MVDYAMISKTGARQNNEDAVGAVEKDGRYGFIVCDGLGGHGMGDIAAQTVVRVFESFFETFSGDIADFLPEMFARAQNALLEKKRALRVSASMCTTAVALVMDAQRYCIGHIGDSRAYVFADGRLVRTTQDHSMAQILVLQGEITEEEIPHHPERNRLLRALGMEADRPMCTVAAPAVRQTGQSFLLCTDGFWEWIPHAEMAHTRTQAVRAEDWLSKMAHAVECSCGQNVPDNYSAVAVLDRG